MPPIRHTWIPTLLALGLLTGPGGVTRAQQVYKSIDADGNVTYSATPPPEGGATQVEELTLQPGPSPDDQRSAHQRLRQNAAASQQLDDQRDKEREVRDAMVSAAQQELIRAQANLEQAKIPGDNDWQHLARGGKVLKPAYRERVRAAEEQVAEAQEKLRAAKKGP